VLAISWILNWDRVGIAAADIDERSGASHYRSTEHAQDMFASSCDRHCDIRARAAEESASRRGSSGIRRVANAHAVFPIA